MALPSNYEDCFRAIGYELDRAGVGQIRLEETVGDIVVTSGGWPPRAVFIFDRERVAGFLNEAKARRGTGVQPRDSPDSYQDMLRAIGKLLDQQGSQEVLIIHEKDDVVVTWRGTLEQKVFDKSKVAELIEEGKRQRHLPEGSAPAALPAEGGTADASDPPAESR